MTPQPQFTGALISRAVTAPPIGFPKTTIGGVPYELRFSFLSSYFLETKANIPAHQLNDWMQRQVNEQHISSMLMVMTGAMLGNVVGGKWKPAPMMAEDVALALTQEEWTGLMAHYTAAIKKVSALMEEALAAARAKAAEPTPEPTPTVM